MFKTLAIDPGLNGAACVIETELDRASFLGLAQIKEEGKAMAFDVGPHKIIDIIDLPTYGEGPGARIHVPDLRKWMLSVAPQFAFIEAASAMPSFKDGAGNRRSMGVSSMFRYGRAVGALEASIASCGIPWRLVLPQKWKKHFQLKGPDKEDDRQCAIKLFPDAESTWFQLKKHHQRADACLQAVYGAEILIREGKAD